MPRASSGARAGRIGPSSRLRIVLDTNVVVSALLWRGTPYRLFEAIRQRPFIALFSSPTLFEELADVLSRPATAKRLAALGKSARDILPDYLDVIELVEPAGVQRIARDPDDDHVLACALAARAEFIVSGDADLLELETFGDVIIVAPAEGLRRIGAQT